MHISSKLLMVALWAAQVTVQQGTNGTHNDAPKNTCAQRKLNTLLQNTYIQHSFCMAGLEYFS